MCYWIDVRLQSLPGCRRCYSRALARQLQRAAQLSGRRGCWGGAVAARAPGCHCCRSCLSCCRWSPRCRPGVGPVQVQSTGGLRASRVDMVVVSDSAFIYGRVQAGATDATTAPAKQAQPSIPHVPIKAADLTGYTSVPGVRQNARCWTPSLILRMQTTCRRRGSGSPHCQRHCHPVPKMGKTLTLEA